jgi:hypothetical protein
VQKLEPPPTKGFQSIDSAKGSLKLDKSSTSRLSLNKPKTESIKPIINDWL